MSNNLTSVSKPQAVIDLNLLSKEEAAEYMGLSISTFKRIAGRIKDAGRFDSEKYYTKQALLDYLTNIQSN